MKRDKWNIKFDWYLSGSTWIQIDRNEQYNENRFISIDDIYFKNQKYLDGVSYTYINKLEDIYKRDLLTGDGYSVYNMYNEYDTIDRIFQNIKIVDIAARTNIDITKQWYKINNIQLKPDHLILLSNQDSEFENDVYKVTKQYFLENADFLSTRTKSDKFNVSVKMGTYKDKQFYLVNNGLKFPITNEPKYFIEGNSFILKHLIKYNLYNTSSNSAVTSKIIFTDYEIARKQLSVNYSLYQDVTFLISTTAPVTSDYFQITHHHDTFVIRSGLTTNNNFSGNTNQIYNNTHPLSGGTTINVSSPFITNVGDYISLVISSGSTTYLSMDTFIKKSTNDIIVIEDLIPNRILRYLSDMKFTILNYNIASSWTEAITFLTLNTPYSRFYDIISLSIGSFNSINISTKEYIYDKYFDYNDITFKVVNGSVSDSFGSFNNYIKYNLYSRLYDANPSVFTTSFSFFNSFNTTAFSWSYTDDSRIKLSFTNSGDTSYFREYTYVYLNADTTKKVMIWKIDNDDIYLERPPSWSSSTGISQINNIDGLYNISQILQEVYINVDYDWYISKKDNIRREICSSYATLLNEKETFRRNVTGLLYENNLNKFILKLYDLDNDQQLSFTTIELMYLGSDKKTRIPVPIEQLTERTTYDYDWNVLDDGLIYSGATATTYLSTMITDEVFDFGLDVVLGGPNDPPLMFTVVDGNA